MKFLVSGEIHIFKKMVRSDGRTGLLTSLLSSSLFPAACNFKNNAQETYRICLSRISDSVGLLTLSSVAIEGE